MHLEKIIVHPPQFIYFLTFNTCETYIFMSIIRPPPFRTRRIRYVPAVKSSVDKFLIATVRSTRITRQPECALLNCVHSRRVSDGV